MSTGSTDLAEMLRSLEAVARPGEYVFATVSTDDPIRELAGATIYEDEGLTVVLPRAEADAHGVSYDFVASWITLTVHSSLEAMGLTAAVSKALADEGIACNVLAGFHHDHLLVPTSAASRALEVLGSLPD